MRVVLDTNILISASWSPGKLEEQVVLLGISGAFSICITSEVWSEYQEVLSRAKFAACKTRSDHLLASLEPVVIRVKPGSRVAAASDEDDNRFLECAEAAGAEFLVTGNLKHYPPEWGATKVVNARQFLCSLGLS